MPFQPYYGGPVIIPPVNPIDWMRLNPTRVIKEKMLRERKLVHSAMQRIMGDNDQVVED